MGNGPAGQPDVKECLSDWILVNKEDWWHTDLLGYGLPPALFLTSTEPGAVATPNQRESLVLGEDLPGVTFAEQVLKFYEAAVGFHAHSPPSPPPFALSHPPFPPEQSTESVERTNKAAWASVVAQFEEDGDGIISPSLSSSVTTLTTPSLDLTSDSDRSTSHSSMPPTPKASEHAVLVKEVTEELPRPPSPVVSLSFPTLNAQPIVEITRDDEGFIVPKKGKESKMSSTTLDDLLPPFLLESVAKAKSSTKSKTRTMVDKLRSSNRDPPAEEAKIASVHDLSFIKPRLGATMDADEDDVGWIGAPIVPAAQGSDSLMALANKARNAFLQGLKRGKAVETVLATPSPKPSGKVKSRGDQTPSDKDGWIEYPSLDTPGKTKLASTKDTVPRRSPPKRTPPLVITNTNHRRTSSHVPQPNIPQLVSTHRPSTSGTFVFPPPPPGPAQPHAWPANIAPPTPMFAAPVPSPFFRGPPPPAMMRPAGPTATAGWFLPNPPVMQQHPPMHSSTYRKPPHVTA